MTRNQIEYAKHLETQRANRAQEALTQQRDAQAHEVSLAQLGETTRHNRAGEAQQVAVLGEQSRHNLATEELSRAQLGELQTHNRATERNAALTLSEQQRANVAREREQQRSNLAQEIELNRSNLAREAETQRSHMVSEQETRNTNTANQVQQAARLAEDVRQHLAREGLDRDRLSETTRHNMVMELKDSTPHISVTTPVTVPLDVNYQAGDVNVSSPTQLSLTQQNKTALPAGQQSSSDAGRWNFDLPFSPF